MKIEDLDPPPAGFGKCFVRIWGDEPRLCAYLENGTPEICYGCARAHLDELAEPKCELCCHPLSGDECRNPVCNFDDRYYDRAYAISAKTGALHRAIVRYKYDQKKPWALIFGRVLAGYLQARRSTFASYDLVIGSPTFVDAERPWDHIDLILERAAMCLSPDWPIVLGEPPVIEQTAAVPRFAKLKWPERELVARTKLYPVLRVPDPTRTRGKRILVFDDVYTDGLRLRVVAQTLIEDGGAEQVSGVYLARSIYRGS
ncbi:MAG: hypothetical protein R3344_03835 [Acidobacteriota bacterium]|nr:hypothetical protein [Acidobacteriota bacterium]